MTRKSKREVERTLNELDDTPPDEPPHWWMADVPRRYWGDEAEALQQFWARVDEAAGDSGGSA